jgi:hypothetical protein
MVLEELKCLKNNEISIKEYVQIRDDVKKRMEHPEWLGDFTIEEIEEGMKSGTNLWLYYQGTEPICSTMCIPCTKRDVEKFEVDINYKDIIDYGPMFVCNNYRGNKLQSQMLSFLDDYYKNKGYKYVLATIHPDNSHSINNLLNDGFKLINQKEFKRGIRNIYIKEF